MAHILMEWDSAGVCGCCLTPSEQLFSYIITRTSYCLITCWQWPLCIRPIRICIVIVHSIHGPRLGVSPHSDISSGLLGILSLLLLVNATQQISFYSFQFSRPGPQPTIHGDRGDHSSLYITDAATHWHVRSCTIPVLLSKGYDW